MTMSTAEIATMVADLQPRLEGGRIERIDQPEEQKLVLRVRDGGARYWVMFCVHPRFSRLHLLTTRPDEGEPAGGFAKMARQHLTGAPVEAFRQVNEDRVVSVDSQERDSMMHPHAVRLVAELVGVGSNLILLDEDDHILAVQHREDSSRRTLAPGEEYIPLEPPERLPPQALENRFEGAADGQDALALSRVVKDCYARLEAEESVESAREELAGSLRSQQRRLRRRRQNVREELDEARNAEQIRRRGELLKIALPEIERGQESVRVRDFFQSDGPEVTIELDPALSPEENLERIFERYKKAKSGRKTLARRLEQTEGKLSRIKNLLQCTEAAETAERLKELRETAREEGLLMPEQPAPGARGEEREGPRVFRSAEGLRILVARSSKENDRLTFTIANGNDFWLHVLGWPGPHVVVRKPKEKAVSPESLLDAAHLAIHFSRLRGTDYAEVAYTQCKHVRRLKGPSGKVSYANASTLQVRVSKSRLHRLLATRERPLTET